MLINVIIRLNLALYFIISCFFRFLTQTSMNAKSEATIVTKMRIVQTQLALTTARAGLDTQAMGAFVKVTIWEDLR